MKSTSFITYMILLFSGLIVVILLLYGYEVLLFFYLKNKWFNSKLAAETLSSILNNIFSTTYNVTIFLKIPAKNYEVFINEEEVKVKIDKDEFNSRLIKPHYINFYEKNIPVKEFNIGCFCYSQECEPCTLIIIKLNNDLIFIK